MNVSRRQHLGRRICSDLDGMQAKQSMPSYFVVAQFYGRTVCADGVDPELTRANIVDRIAAKQYDAIAFIHWCHDGECEDVTNALLKEAGFYTEPTWADGVMSRFDQLIAQIDHDRDTRKHEVV